MERVEQLLRLVLAPDIGCVTVNRLLAHFGGADAVLGASETALAAVEGLRAPQVKGALAAARIDPRPELDLAAKHNVSFLTYDDPLYPPALRRLYDPPCLLYCRGELLLRDQASVAIVGTRQASHYGREQSERFGGLLARAGYTVVSGLARGVDTFAHRGALAARGRTLAVLGCGLAHIYPEENRDLAAEIARSGAVLSEFPMDLEPTRETFPRRNRIIAGLSLGVLVVEAPERSGALITAKYAMETGREVFAVPGRIDHENAAGCHALLRDGATLVRNLDDLLAELGPPPEPPPPEPEARASGSSAAPSADPTEAKILAALTSEPTHIDKICVLTGLPAHKVSATLMILEIKRQVAQKPGKLFVKLREG